MRRFAFPRRAATGRSAWQVIYMDLMTIIMVFFVILWSINQREEVGVSESIGDETVKMVNLPGDVLFAPNQTTVTKAGRRVFSRLFDDPEGRVLDFDTGGLVKRVLVIHGHTDSDGDKAENLELGYQRALSAYEEIKQYGGELSDHVIICSHADNSPALEVPVFQGTTTPAERAAIRKAKAQNRRITIEDKVVNRPREGNL